ncbi:beta-lactamase regulatory protein [Tamlana nanhaiensis]|uniref:Beta-lactamase regulatory protein n=1 Tax=Neotamlana nanhaiensis TaxID=1382798 RepID=A0A0D7VW19_9FLAO|nr:glycosyltransferase [Tamlana nanhaiensis]KJD31075.1 beta-lactamase regulatory protein [Tamlana nanhaiensis]
MMILSLLITLIYLILIGSFIIGFNKVEDFKLKKLPPKTRFSIIIPFRNEAENLPRLLKSIENLNYHKLLFEVFLVDDASEDNSVEVIVKSGSDAILIPNKRKTKSPKKDAITTAMDFAKHEWIITTDADCELPKYWLDTFDAYIQNHNVDALVAPINYTNKNSFLNQFQILDSLSLQGATIGGFGLNKPFMCNGANFSYKKSVFKSLKGFKGNQNIASGDDVFFLEKLIKQNKTIGYVKSKHAIVKTKTQDNWRDLIAQHIRWAAKTSKYNNMFGKITGLFVLLMNAFIVTGILLTILGFINPFTFLGVVIAKALIDLILLSKTASFFNQKQVLKHFALGFFVYSFFSVFVAVKSMFTGYTWKGRSFKA